MLLKLFVHFVILLKFSNAEKLIIDTDAGSDDAIAILMLLRAEKLQPDKYEIIAITCTYGNTKEENVEINVLKTLTFANRSDIPVFRGAKKPLLEDIKFGNYYGEDGFGDSNISMPIEGHINESIHASIALIELTKRYQGNISIISLGPTTNIALAISLDENLINRVNKFHVMGSSVTGVSRYKPNVEFNFGADPESNYILLNSTNHSQLTLFPFEAAYNTKIPKICDEKNCTCVHRRILNCLDKGMNLEVKIILDKLKNIGELRDSSGSTLLHYSMEYGNVEMLQHLIDKGCDVDAQDAFGTTPLNLAIKAIGSKAVQILINNNANIYLTDNEGNNSLQLAFASRFHSKSTVPFIVQNSQLILDMIVEKINDDFSNDRFRQFLLNADNLAKLNIVALCSIDVTNFVLANDYPIDYYETQHGCTALHYAIMLSKFENARLLVIHGANVNALDYYTFTPLHYYWGDFESVDENSEVLARMLQQSADLLLTADVSGLTDVEICLMSGKEKTVRTILENVIDVDACVNKDSSLLHRLVANNNLSNFDFLNELNYIKFDVNKTDAGGQTPLMLAVYEGYPEKVEFLLEHGADVDEIGLCRDKLVYSKLLENASVNPDKDRDVARVIELLLQYGGNVEFLYKDKSRLLNYLYLNTKVIVAHWAFMWTVKESSLTQQSRDIMESKSELKNYFYMCTDLLQEMKLYQLYDTVTLFEVLTDRDEYFICSNLYACNEEFVSSFSSIMEKLSCFQIYYVNILRRILAKLLDDAKLEKAIKTLTGLCSNRNYRIVRKIFDYLDRQDLCNLCEVVR